MENQPNPEPIYPQHLKHEEKQATPLAALKDEFSDDKNSEIENED